MDWLTAPLLSHMLLASEDLLNLSLTNRYCAQIVQNYKRDNKDITFSITDASLTYFTTHEHRLLTQMHQQNIQYTAHENGAQLADSTISSSEQQLVNQKRILVFKESLTASASMLDAFIKKYPVWTGVHCRHAQALSFSHFIMLIHHCESLNLSLSSLKLANAEHIDRLLSIYQSVREELIAANKKSDRDANDASVAKRPKVECDPQHQKVKLFQARICEHLVKTVRSLSIASTTDSSTSSKENKFPFASPIYVKQLQHASMHFDTLVMLFNTYRVRLVALRHLQILVSHASDVHRHFSGLLCYQQGSWLSDNSIHVTFLLQCDSCFPAELQSTFKKIIEEPKLFKQRLSVNHWAIPRFNSVTLKVQLQMEYTHEEKESLSKAWMDTCAKHAGDVNFPFLLKFAGENNIRTNAR